MDGERGDDAGTMNGVWGVNDIIQYGADTKCKHYMSAEVTVRERDSFVLSTLLQPPLTTAAMAIFF